MKTSITFLLLILIPVFIIGQINLPKLISDGMILQRNTDLKIWGWASANENIEISFIDSSYNTIANANGEWSVVIGKHKEGGPYNMILKGENTITVNNILFGDVWLCSGQSNMQLPMSRVGVIYGDEIATSENPLIRQFTVPVKWNYMKPQTNLHAGKWVAANPHSIGQFSAVGYFFARELNAKYNIPVGILLCAAGGSCAEGWISEEALKAFPEQYTIAKQLSDTTYMRNLLSSEKSASVEWFSELSFNDLGRKDTPWMSSELDDSNWPTLQIPSSFNETDMDFKNGVAWFRKEIKLPENSTGKVALLELGRIVDSDSAFINGKFIGTTSYQYPPRRYNVEAGILKGGKNIITIRVVSQSGGGAFIKDKPYQLAVNGQIFDLKGTWKYKVAAKIGTCPSSTYFPGEPLGLYNAMLYPVVNYSVKGVVWYQGESNINRPNNYFEVMTTLINEWRTLKNEKELPFLCVQLPNFMEEKKEPSESNLAIIRNHQLKLLSVPNTSMVVTLGLGEWNDIHPLRKKEVGERLALAAANRVYGENNIVYSGPIYKAMKIIENKIELSFDNCGSGLITQGNDKLKYFAIAGADKKYVWAKAIIEGNKVIVSSNQIKNPVAVRYAWADNPEGANLFNTEGLPASPFTTQ